MKATWDGKNLKVERVRKKTGCIPKDFEFKLIDGCLICTSHTYKEKFGYTRIVYEGKIVPLHRLIYKLLNPKENIDEYMVLHSCDNPHCCNPDHLRSGTNADNMNDVKIRNRRKGEKSGRSKLTDLKVLEIRENKTNLNQRQLAKKYNVDYRTISYVINRKTWTHI